MKSEILTLVEFLEKEHGLDKGTVIDIFEKSCEAVARKKDKYPPIQVHLDSETGDVTVISNFTIVPDDYTEPESDGDESEEDEIGPHMTLSSAKAHPMLSGNTLEEWDELTIGPYPFEGFFSRIDIQTIKQITMQKIRDAKRETILREYHDKIGELIDGKISRIERGSYIVDLERTEAVIPRREQSPLEHYKVNDHIRAVVSDIKSGDEARGPRVVLSRAVPALVRRLFEIEVPEIYDGLVEIVGIVREAGQRTKLAVMSHDRKIDATGACVGQRGVRVKAVVQEINGEKVDVIRWDGDLETFIREALKPAEVLQYAEFDNDEILSVVVVVPDEQHISTVGRGGLNVRLISNLATELWNSQLNAEDENRTAQKIDIKEELRRQAEEEDKEASENSQPQE